MLFARFARRVSLLVPVAALAASPVAQGTTGVATINDYTVNTLTPGSDSCTPLSIATGLVTFNVDTEPNAPVVFMFNLNCPCDACFFPWVPSACPLPLMTCFPGNQAFELDTTGTPCLFRSIGVNANAAGQATFVLFVPPFVRFSTQAVLIHSCDATNLTFTQAYDVSVT